VARRAALALNLGAAVTGVTAAGPCAAGRGARTGASSISTQGRALGTDKPAMEVLLAELRVFLGSHALLLLALVGLLLTVSGGLAWRLWRGRSAAAARQGASADARGRDPLTGLVSREALEEALAVTVSQADAAGRRVCVAYLGLDGFRAINDAYGMRVGDAVLNEIGTWLAGWLHGRPQVARVGGDEFVLFCHADGIDLDDLAATLQRLVGQPLQAEALNLQVGSSIGLALYPDDGARPRLVAHAALAMRSVKHTGGNGHARFDPAMATNHRAHAEMSQDLRHALARGQLQLVYQPKIDARSLQITAAEALLRWQHPRRGLVSPSVFVPLAERHGLIRVIGAWVIEEACCQAAQWREIGLRMRIAVNISGHQLRSEDFVDQLLDSMRRHGIPPDRLSCEITENLAIEDTPATRAAFDRMRRAGLHVSIDDFGAGFSPSLAQLRRLAPAELKIDGSLVTDLAHDEAARASVRAIVQLARSLQLHVVAEGVETEAQRDTLVALGCDELQGYLFAKPMSAAALALWASGDGPAAASAFRPSLFDPTAPAALA
jgi:diguanylate cyclase (GGDEF)-like protein